MAACNDGYDHDDLTDEEFFASPAPRTPQREKCLQKPKCQRDLQFSSPARGKRLLFGGVKGGKRCNIGTSSFEGNKKRRKKIFATRWKTIKNKVNNEFIVFCFNITPMYITYSLWNLNA
jgi:hypothetical protein